MILQSKASRFALSDRLGTHRGMSVSGLACPQAGLRRLRFSFFSDEPTLSKVIGASFLPAGLQVARGKRVLLGPVAQLVRARA
jgi:hypothetical protein